MGRLVTNHIAVGSPGPTTIHTAGATPERVLGITVCNTTISPITFTLQINQNGTRTSVLEDLNISGQDTLENPFAMFIIGSFTEDGRDLIPDVLEVSAGGSGLEAHLFVEVLDPE